MHKHLALDAEVEKDTARIPVWLVDDNRYYSTTVSSLLNESSEVACTRTFSRCEPAIEALRNEENPPRVILLDIQMPGMDGLEAIRPMKAACPAAQILMITVYNDEEYVRTAMKAGASGYLLKKSSAAEFIRAIQSVLDGGIPIDPFVMPNVIKSITFPRRRLKTLEGQQLTRREMQFLRLIANGLNDQEIAVKLGVSYNTALYHTKNIHEKLNVHSRRELIVKAHKNGLL